MLETLHGEGSENLMTCDTPEAIYNPFENPSGHIAIFHHLISKRFFF